MNDTSNTFTASRAAINPAAIAGFIDGTVITIAHPSKNEVQNVAYNGHKRRNALTFQAFATPDGLFIHDAGPTERRSHHQTLYIRSGLDNTLGTCLLEGNTQYALYDCSEYSKSPVIEVIYQGSQLTMPKYAFNASIAQGRAAVEWCFKEVKLHWYSISYKCKMRTGKAPVGALYRGALSLTIMNICIHHNTI